MRTGLVKNSKVEEKPNIVGYKIQGIACVFCTDCIEPHMIEDYNAIYDSELMTVDIKCHKCGKIILLAATIEQFKDHAIRSQQKMFCTMARNVALQHKADTVSEEILKVKEILASETATEEQRYSALYMMYHRLKG